MLNKRCFKLFSLLLLVSAIAFAAQFVPYPTEDFSQDTAYKVLDVVDGDTVKIQYDGKPTTFRLIGVDTPETVHPTKPVEQFGKEAVRIYQKTCYSVNMFTSVLMRRKPINTIATLPIFTAHQTDFL